MSEAGSRTSLVDKTGESLLEGFTEDEVKIEIKRMYGYELNLQKGLAKVEQAIFEKGTDLMLQSPQTLYDNFKSHLIRLETQVNTILEMLTDGSEREQNS